MKIISGIVGERPIGEWRIDFDGRLDNRADLSKQLGGVPTPDAGIVLASYRRWGEDCVKRFVGDFAFCIHDPDLQRVFCGCDKIGIKGLYFQVRGPRLFYSSDLTRLIALLPDKLECDMVRLAGQLYGHWWDQSRTFYKDVRCLPAAHNMTWQPTGLRESRYWQITARPPLHYASDREYAEHFLELFRRAVANRLAPQGRSGIFLSGGVDSSAVAALARQTHPQPQQIALYSMAFDDKNCDDSAATEEFARGQPWSLQFVFPERDPASLDFDGSAEFRDVVYAPDFYILRSLLQAAKADKVSAVLTGHGGDDVFNPGFYLADCLRHGQLRQILDHLRQPEEGNAAGLRQVWQEGVRPILTSFLPHWTRRFMQRRSAANILSSRFLKTSGLETGATASIGNYHGEFAEFSQRSLARRLYLTGGYTYALRQFQALGQRYGVEFHFPFYDEALVDFAFQLPPQQFFRTGVTKWVLRQAMAGILSPQVQMRHHVQDFEPVLSRSFDRQRDIILNYAEDSRLLAAGLLDPRRLRKLRETATASTSQASLILLYDIERKLRAAEARRKSDGQDEAKN